MIEDVNKEIISFLFKGELPSESSSDIQEEKIAKKREKLNLSKEEIADTIILVGDPERVELVSNKFDRVIHRIQHREFITHTGLINKKKMYSYSSSCFFFIHTTVFYSYF